MSEALRAVPAYTVTTVTTLPLFHCNTTSINKHNIPYGGKLWRVQTLAEWQGKHHWRNKLWRIDDKSLIKRILKQFEYKSTHNWSIRVHVFANAD